MKKLMALLMAAMMVFTLCFALADGEDVTSVYYDSTLRFDLKVPDGYTLEVERDGIILGLCLNGGENNYDIDILVCPDDTYAEFNRFNDMSEEQLNQEMAALSAGYNDPTATIIETGEGTKLIKIDENGCEMDYAEIIGLYKGFVIDVYIAADDGGELTDDDLAAALAFCSDWQFVTVD